ncbi:putative golgin subfamily A member 6-like protein 3 [Anabrus simplex]
MMSYTTVKLVAVNESPRGLYAVISMLLLTGGIERNPGPVFETRCKLCAVLYGSLVEDVEMREVQLRENTRVVEELERRLTETENSLRLWEEVLKKREMVIEQREEAFEKKVKEVEKACNETTEEMEKACKKREEEVERACKKREEVENACEEREEEVVRACKDREKIVEQQELEYEMREKPREREWRDRREGPRWQELLTQCEPGHEILQQILNWAADQGYINVVNFLLARNPCVDWKRTALNHAAERGQLLVVRFLIEEEKNQGQEDCLSFGRCDIDVNIGAHSQGVPALLLAAKEGHMEVVRYLVEEGGITGEMLDTALVQAAQWGHLDIVSYLTTLGPSSLNVKANGGYTPLHLAA